MTHRRPPRLRLAIQRLRVRRALARRNEPAICSAYDRLVQLESPEEHP